MRVAGERLHPAIRARLLHPPHPTGHLGTGRGSTCFGVFHEAVGTKWLRCAVRPDRDWVNGSAGRTAGKGRLEPLPIHGWERTGCDHGRLDRMIVATPVTRDPWNQMEPRRRRSSRARDGHRHGRDGRDRHGGGTGPVVELDRWWNWTGGRPEHGRDTAAVSP